MSKTTSLICALITTFIWGTAFIAQDTGMDNIGPLSFNAARFFVGFLTILPIAIILERKKIIVEVKSNKKLFFRFLFMMSVSLFLGTFLQQTSLLYTNLANSAFFTVFYVPIVPVILFFIYKIKVHWSIWPSILLCLTGVYFLSDFSDAERENILSFKGVQPIKINENILRSETAVISAISIINYVIN